MVRHACAVGKPTGCTVALTCCRLMLCQVPELRCLACMVSFPRGLEVSNSGTAAVIVIVLLLCCNMLSLVSVFVCHCCDLCVHRRMHMQWT